jgi:O-antigen/teichoic acid export membrane protein
VAAAIFVGSVDRRPQLLDGNVLVPLHRCQVTGLCSQASPLAPIDRHDASKPPVALQNRLRLPPWPAVAADDVIETDAEGPSGARRLAANAAWMVTGQAVAKAASFAFVLIVTRGLDSAAYGHFNFAASFVPLFLVVGTWGLDIALIREIARDRNRFSELLASGLAVRLGLGTGAVVLSVAGGAFFVETGTAFATLVLVAVALLLDEVTNLLGSAFKAFERMAFFSMALVVNRIATTALALVAVGRGGGIVAVSAMYVLGSAGALVAAAVALRRFFPPVRLRDADRATVRELLHHGAPLGIAAALNMALLRVDAVLLQAFEGAVAVGFYGIAFRFFDSFLFVAYGLGVVAMPRIARSHWSPESENGFNAVLAVMLAFYVPLAVGGAFLSRWAVTLLFSSRYAEAADAVRWLTAAALFYAVAYLCRFSAVALGRRPQIAVVAAVVLGFNVLANLFAIPRYGFDGAAVVTFLSEVLEAVVLVALLRRSVGRLRVHRLVGAPLVAGGAMAVALVLTDSRDGTAALLAAAVYAAALAGSALVIAPGQARDVVARLRAR